MTSEEYLLDNRADEAERRFGALSALYDPVTFRHIDALGIQYGWRCWEVGAGGPSVPRWLADRVGPTGRVLATDIETRWIDHLAPRIDVRRHDVATDDPPSAPVDGFDLIHARLVLVHVPARDEALRRLAGALRPGGWLLIEDFDLELQPLASIEAYRPEHDVANKIREGFLALLAQRGVDLSYGRKLPRLLADNGLVGVGADAYMSVSLPAMGALEAANVDQLGDALVGQEHATAEEIEGLLAAIEDGLGIASPPLISAWGRKPPG